MKSNAELINEIADNLSQAKPRGSETYLEMAADLLPIVCAAAKEMQEECAHAIIQYGEGLSADMQSFLCDLAEEVRQIEVK